MRLFFLLLFSAFMVRGQFAPHEMFHAASYTNAKGRVVAYQVSAPQFPRPEKKYPILLFLHGSGECGTNNHQQLRQGIPALMKGLVKRDEPTIVIAPQCRISNMWVRRVSMADTYAAEANPTLALRDALEICEEWIRERHADPNRFYIAGLSLGAFGVWDAIQRTPEKFAAAVAICGNGDIRKMPKGLKKLPIWVAHGRIDKNVPVACSRRMVETLRQKGNNRVVYVEYEQAGHDIWNRVLADTNLQAWLFEQSREKKPWWKFW